MSKLTLTMWMTLDGFIADANNSVNWIFGDDEMSAYEIGVVSNADTLLLGRRTYQDFITYWPDAPDNPATPAWEKTYARKLNALKTFVVSQSLEQATWQGTTVLKDINP